LTLARLFDLAALLKEYAETTSEDLPRKKIAEILLRIVEKEALEREKQTQALLTHYYDSDYTGI